MIQLSFSSEKFLPKTVYVTYIASTPEKVWEALTSAEFTKRFFFGRAVEVEPKVGGSFAMRMPDGRYDIKGKVIELDRRAGCPSPGKSISRSSGSCRNRW